MRWPQVTYSLTKKVCAAFENRESLTDLRCAGLLFKVRSRMHAPNDLFVVNGGNHSLQISAKDQEAQGITYPQMEAAILEAIARFLREHGDQGELKVPSIFTA